MEANVNQPSVEVLFAELCREFGGKFVALPDKPEETVEATVRALWFLATGQRLSADKALELVLPSLTGEGLEKLKALMEQRLHGVPLAHLTGRQSFMGLEFICNRDALIPRKETEILAGEACALLEREILPSNPKPRVLDLCCGSGNVACTIACKVPSCVVMAADLSSEAVELAKENARALECAERVTFRAGDLFAPFELEEYLRSFDLITCNPPYITSGKLTSMPAEIIRHEPRLAFDGGPLGVGVLWRLWREAPRFLKEKGWMAFEVGLGQGQQVLQRLSKSAQYTSVRGVADKAGNPRAIVCKVAG